MGPESDMAAGRTGSGLSVWTGCGRQVISSLPVGGRKLEAPDPDMDQDSMEVRSPEDRAKGFRSV